MVEQKTTVEIRDLTQLYLLLGGVSTSIDHVLVALREDKLAVRKLEHDTNKRFDNISLRIRQLERSIYYGLGIAATLMTVGTIILNHFLK